MRSNRFNPVYYDSKATYKPWSPAYLDGNDLPAYANADPNAALSHPLYASGPSLKLNANWDSTATKWSSNGYRFFLQGGMKVPAGSYLNATTDAARDPGSAQKCQWSTSPAMPLAMRLRAASAPRSEVSGRST